MAIISVLLSMEAQSTLIDRGNGLIYDDVLDITWAQDANLWGQTGTWDQAVAWADGLIFQGYDDWRLASVSVAAGLPTGANDLPVSCSAATESECRDNELGYMFYQNLAGSFGTDLTGDQGLFRNIQSGYYWSGTTGTSNSTIAWIHHFQTGGEIVWDKSKNSTAWAVRDGDIDSVPLPGTALLICAGFLGLGNRVYMKTFVLRRKHSSPTQSHDFLRP